MSQETEVIGIHALAQLCHLKTDTLLYQAKTNFAIYRIRNSGRVYFTKKNAKKIVANLVSNSDLTKVEMWNLIDSY